MNVLKLWPAFLVLAACSSAGTQKADVEDKVTELQVPHVKAECEELAKKTAPKGKCGRSLFFGSHLDEIHQRTKDLESFTPGREWLVRGSTYNHLLNAISPKARKEWLTSSKALDLEECPQLQAGYCFLAAAAAEKIPLYTVNTKAYPHQDGDELKLMKTAITELSAHTIFYMGVEEDSWLIEKNGYGIPTARFKHGMAYVRYALDDHPFCRTYFINIVQDYAGGSSYGDSTVRFVDDGLVACPK